MENSDEVGSDEINELFALTARLEQQIANFSFTGEGVSGSMPDGGFIVPSSEDETSEDD